MLRKDIKIASGHGGEFDCYLVLPEDNKPVPAIVLASAVHGVDNDIRAIADEFGAQGYIAAAPDLFSRSIPGPLPRDDPRTKERSQPRLARIAEGERDMADTLAEVRKLPQFNGRAAAMGFCYGGPYAILGPKRRQSVSSGATSIMRRRPPCAKRMLRLRRVCATSSCTCSPACSTAT
jgi:carboxymethylenebutenolidase